MVDHRERGADEKNLCSKIYLHPFQDNQRLYQYALCPGRDADRIPDLPGPLHLEHAVHPGDPAAGLCLCFRPGAVPGSGDGVLPGYPVYLQRLPDGLDVCDPHFLPHRPAPLQADVADQAF